MNSVEASAHLPEEVEEEAAVVAGVRLPEEVEEGDMAAAADQDIAKVMKTPKLATVVEGVFHIVYYFRV